MYSYDVHVTVQIRKQFFLVLLFCEKKNQSYPNFSIDGSWGGEYGYHPVWSFFVLN